MPGMYEKKIGRAYGRGCLRSLAAMVVGGVLGVILVAVVLWLIQGGTVAPRSFRFTLALLVPQAFIVLPVLAGILWIAARGRRLDRAFEPLGWDGRQFGPTLRRWLGEFRGRAVQVWFSKGPTLEVYVDCSPATRAIVHEGGPIVSAIAGALDKRGPLDPSPLPIEGVSVVAYDEDWFRALLGRSRAAGAVTELMADDPRTATAVTVLPGSVRLMRRFMPVRELRAETFAAWLNRLVDLAEEIDRAGPSSDGLKETRLEAWARLRRGKYVRRVLIGLALFYCFASFALYVFAWLNVGQS